MITNNYRKILTSIITSTYISPKGLIPIVDNQNRTRYINGDFYHHYPGLHSYTTMRYTAEGQTYYGSVTIGGGNKAESENDYELETPILSGFSGSVVESLGLVDGQPYLELTVTIQNTGSGSIIVKEIGLFSLVSVSLEQYGTETNRSAYVMLDRTVLSTPVTIAGGETKTIYYRISSLLSAGSGGGGILSIIAKSITANGTFDPQDDDADGYSMVTVNVPNSYAAGDEGKVVDDGALVAQTARATEITINGTYDTTLNNSVTVNISGGGGGATLITKSITANGTYNASSDSADGYSSVEVEVPNTYAAADEGKVVSGGALVAQTARATSITENGTYDTTGNNSVTVNVSGGGGLPLGIAMSQYTLTDLGLTWNNTAEENVA